MKRLVSYGAFLLLVQLATACGPTSDTTGNSQSGERGERAAAGNRTAGGADEAMHADLVVAFGDSLFAGYHLDREEGFAPALERKLADIGRPAQVFNAGVSGDTSAAGLRRLAFVLDGLPKKPDLVIVGFGGNDMLRGLSPQETRKNLAAIMDELDRRDIKVMLAGMVAAPNMGMEYAQAFNSIYPDLAGHYDAPLYPFILDGVVGNEKLLLPDGLHPNPQGIEKMVAGIAPVAAKALDR
ncbi:arylesterase [Rhizorhapis sp. SPR117]|uniref:arylesterase n=1 Tax=Rhizorhapis sp. SPR117 TaxID=2912611 RepID=UPI001F43BE51|nr:arylesterase [Rhizorhapis sp. SPR117]